MFLFHWNLNIIDATIERCLTTFGTFFIEGIKWCGKTWMSSYHYNSEIFLAILLVFFKTASLPQSLLNWSWTVLRRGSLTNGKKVSTLWNAVRHKVDQRVEKDNSF